MIVLNQITPEYHTLEIGSLLCGFSYKVLIGIGDYSTLDPVLYITDRVYSTTTTNHTNDFIQRNSGIRKNRVLGVSQQALEGKLALVTSKVPKEVTSGTPYQVQSPVAQVIDENNSIFDTTVSDMHQELLQQMNQTTTPSGGFQWVTMDLNR